MSMDELEGGDFNAGSRDSVGLEDLEEAMKLAVAASAGEVGGGEEQTGDR